MNKNFRPISGNIDVTCKYFGFSKKQFKELVDSNELPAAGKFGLYNFDALEKIISGEKIDEISGIEW